jgi:NAD(P)-dependent dehydrogenase (short-subunit alcohol dehydrogenase family)
MNTAANENTGQLAGQRALVISADSGIGEAIAKVLFANYTTGTTLFVDGGMMLYSGFRTGG